jgi:alpha-amylase
MTPIQAPTKWIIAVLVLFLTLPAWADSVPRTAFVHLFEWKWSDVGKECKEVLGPKGFAAVQISPPNEHRVVDQGNRRYPWWQRYQPVSYLLESRSGSRAQLAQMISDCNQAGVKIYADVVINHMAGIDLGPGTGSAGSPFDPSARSFPAVPYGDSDFHDRCEIDYKKADSVRDCWIGLNGGTLTDLRTEKNDVREKTAAYMNELIGLGIAGFRIDAAKHMRPGDIADILGRVDDLGAAIDPNTGQPFHQPGRPYVFMEVIGAENEPVKPEQYTAHGDVTEFLYGKKLAGKFRDPAQKLAELRTFPGHPESDGWDMLPSHDAVAFIDNHDNQRGHGSGAWQNDGRIANILTFHYDGNLYNLANVFMLAWPYGYPKVMSSYDWPRNVQWTGNKQEDVNDWMGPPADALGDTKDVDCDSPEWVCEHRWGNIANMVAFRNHTGREQADWTVTHWWDNGNNRIAFGRNGKGFVVINKEGDAFGRTFDTGMPEGTYCDVLKGDFDPVAESCGGPSVIVDGSGKATFSVPGMSASAIHVGARLANGGPSRTVVFMYGQTQEGQDMFLRGGIDHFYAERQLGRTCQSSAGFYDCAMPITHTNLANDTTRPWKQGDRYLDWYGAEPLQTGISHGIQAVGTPMDWTTSNPGHGSNVDQDGHGFSPLNQKLSLGDHYWMMDVLMDCSKGVQAAGESWFEVKSYISNTAAGWEGDIHQPDAPYQSINHFAKCGEINVFRRNENTATYYDLP